MVALKSLRIVAALIAVSLVACSSSSSGATPAASPVPTTASLQSTLVDELSTYLADYATSEHISGASLSVNIPAYYGSVDVAAGTTGIGTSTAVTPSNLFQIGSNTKAFTAVALLHLQRAGKLSMTDTVGKWLPQYPQWKKITITQLLNMTSGIATYDSTPAWETQYVANPYANVTPQQLIAFIDPNAALKSGWTYSNTGYIMCQLIIESASGESYTSYIDGIIAEAGLHHTFYQPNLYPAPVYDLIIDGYYDNSDPGNEGLSALLGKNVRPYSLSWAQAAGGIVSTMSDLVNWARDLYTGPILRSSERRQLEALVSTETGKPISGTSAANPRGFGLGVSQVTRAPIGTFWFYIGETLGFRVAHVYVPSTGITLALGLNSQPSPSQDHIGALISQVYETVLAATTGSASARQSTAQPR